MLKNSSSEKDQQFIETVEGIGDILVFDTKVFKNKNVIEGLRRTVKIIKDFILKQKKDPEKFKRLFLIEDVLKSSIEKNEIDKNIEEIQEKILNQGKYLSPFSTLLNQILRIHKAAIEVKNSEISTEVTKNLNGLLENFSSVSDNEIFINQILDSLFDITKFAVEHQDKKSIYLSSVNWYIRIVLNKVGEKENKFNISYLDLFDKYFFKSVTYIIDKNQFSVFKGLVGFLVDGIFSPYYSENKIHSYISFIITLLGKEKYKELKIEKIIKEIEDKIQYELTTKEKYNDLMKKIDEIRELIQPSIGKEKINDFIKKETELIFSVDAYYKYNNLLKITFALGAYCLFKGKYEFIKCLWEFKQPSDADASWIGNDIVPSEIDQIIKLYFEGYTLHRKFDFFEDHHGSEVYYKEYFLLLLNRVIKNKNISTEEQYKQIAKETFNRLNIHQISDLEKSIDDLINYLDNIKEKKNLLSLLGFDIRNIPELFDDKLVPFLKGLQKKAQQTIEGIYRRQDVSLSKVDEFKIDVLKSFNESIVLREIFKSYKLYEDKTKEINKNISRIGINTISDKAPFFDEWYVNYFDWGSGFGRDLAHWENSFILKKIVENCNRVSGKNINKFLDSFSDLSNIIIFCINIDLYDFFGVSNNFIYKNHKNCQRLDINGFKGWYKYKRGNIAVFEMYPNNIGKKILILNMSKIGKLIQYSPLDEEEEEYLKKGIFYFNIQSFSTNIELMNEFIKNHLDELQKIGNKEEQKIYLQKKVLINIFEKNEYVKNKEFQGYSLSIDKSD
jgi:hypothetical protein